MTLMSCVKSPHIFPTKHFFLLSKRSDLTHSFHLHNNRGEVLTCVVVYTEEIWAASSEDAFFVTPLTLRGLFSFWWAIRFWKTSESFYNQSQLLHKSMRACVSVCVFVCTRKRERVWEYLFALLSKKRKKKNRLDVFFFPKLFFLGMNAETCVSYCEMTSMDSYYSPSAPQGRDHQANPFRTFQASDTKYSPAFLTNKGQAYGEKSGSPFQQECQSLDATAGEGTFNKYHLFMQRSSCKTPPDSSKLQQESGHNGGLIACYGEFQINKGLACREKQLRMSSGNS